MNCDAQLEAPVRFCVQPLSIYTSFMYLLFAVLAGEEAVGRSGSDYGVNICNSYSGVSTNLSVVSPGYPYSYPDSVECRCFVTGQRHSKVDNGIVRIVALRGVIGW